MATLRVKRSTGSTAPSVGGITFGEPAFVDGLNSFYIAKNDGSIIRIGAQVDTSKSLASADDLKIPTTLAVKTYVDANIAGGAVSTVNGFTGAITIAAGNQATLSAVTGTITVGVTSNPSFTTLTTSGNSSVGGNLTVTGNLTINGSTTTVNTDTITVDDPVITLGLSGGSPIGVSDGGKSRGIAISYFDGSAGQTGFIGFTDQTAPVFAVYSKTNLGSDTLASGSTFGILQANGLYLQRDANTASVGRHVLTSQSTTHGGGGRQAIFPDHGGYVLLPSTLGTAEYILKSNGSSSQPTWIDSNSAGFTAFTSTNVLTASDTSDTSAVIAFLPAALATNQGIKYNSGLTYNAVTNSLSATTFVGSLSGNASTATTATSANTLTTSRSIGLTGDVSGSASFNGSADINITATIAPNSVELGTDTTGNYIATLSTTSGAGLTISGSGSENAAVTINLSKINTGIDFGNFAFTAGEFTNTSGTVAIGTVDGGTF
jgi:hypothetical protein